MESFDELTNKLKRIVAAHGNDFTEPEEDWSPALFLIKEEKYTPIELDSALLETGDGKEIMADIIEQEIVRLEPEAACFTCSAYERLLPLNKVDENGVVNITDEELNSLEIQREILVVIVCDSDHVVSLRAPILRDNEQAPVLGNWEEEMPNYTDRFMLALLRGLEKINNA